MEYFKLRLDLIIRSAESARWFLAATVIASTIQIGAVYNATLSQTRELGIRVISDFNSKHDWDPQNRHDGKSKNGPVFEYNEITRELQDELLKKWVDSTSFAIPIVGIAISENDVTLLGSMSLTVLSFCLFAGLKRENRLITRTLKALERERWELKELVYEGLLSSQIFSLAGLEARGNRETELSIVRILLKKLATSLKKLTTLPMSSGSNGTNRDSSLDRGFFQILIDRFPSWLAVSLIFSPVVAVVAGFVSDVASLCLSPICFE